jgi:L,D-transpeptidase YcbB
MFPLGLTARPVKAAILALAATLAPVAAGWAQSAAPYAQDIVIEAPPEADKADAPPAAAEKAPVAAAKSQISETLQAPEKLVGPEKPSSNQAIRAALIRVASDIGRVAPEWRPQRRALEAYYAARGDAPVWLDHGQWTPAARSVFQRLQRAGEDGLDLRAFRVYSLDQGSEAAMALADVALSEAVAAYAFQASGGRVDPARISRLIGARPQIVAPAQALDETSTAPDADSALQSFNPHQPGYIALREKLEQMRADSAPVALLAATETSRRASDAVGAIRPGRNAGLESEILVNMEFWRWQPRDFAADRIVVNIPEFYARLYRDNALILESRVIVGKPDKPTPLFSNRMEYLIVNPSWNVPQSIIKNEMMNKLDSLRRMGYDVEYIGGRLHVRQPPGERNALGRIKFIFPNDYAVYMHDTPTRNLFASTKRAFSHGCVRVDQPFKLAETLLRPDRGWTEARIKKLLGNSERRVSLPEPLPIHIVYFTINVDEKGEMRRFDDVYAYSGKLRALLGLGG